MEKEWDGPYLPLGLNTPPENPVSAMNDDLANYAVTNPAIVPVNNGAGQGKSQRKISLQKPTNKPAI